MHKRVFKKGLTSKFSIILFVVLSTLFVLAPKQSAQSDEADAALQTTVETVFLQQGKLSATDSAAQDSLSFSVAISGDTAVVGAPRNSGGTNLQQRGSAYVYVRGATGAWTQQQKLAPSDGAATDQFGYSVAISGNTIAVGRYNTTTGQNRADGKVYIFTRSGSTWTETQTIQSADIAQGDSFGYSIALEGDTLAVGARNKTDGTTFFKGAAYIFIRPAGGGNFSQQAKLTASDGGASDFFGEAVALSGETALIGSVNDFGTPNANGKAYVFVRNGTSWSEQQILQAQNGSPNGAFGVSVSVSGDTALIGARNEVVSQTTGEVGAAYVFTRTGATWTQTQRLTAQEATPRNDTFGYAVAIKGDTLAIGSPAHEYLPSIANHGAVYVYRRSGATFSRTQKLIHSDPAPDALGQSLAFDGNSILAGAPAKNSARGAAYVFASVRPNAQKILDPTGEGDDYFGISIATSGDTLVIGAQQDDNGPNGGNQGSASVYVRNASGVWTLQQKLLAGDGVGGDFFGASVAISGDTLVVGAFFEDSGTTNNQGAAYVFTRTGTIWTQQAKLLASDPAGFDTFGSAVAIDGDSIAVGAPQVSTGGINARGAVYLFTRSGAVWTQQAKLLAAAPVAGDFLGNRISISGNTVIAGATNVEQGRGAAYVFNRTGATWTEGQRLTASDGAIQDFFGSSVAVRGDEAMIGATQAGPNDRGAVYYFTRTNGVWTERQRILPTNALISAQFGSAVAFDDASLVVGAQQDYITNGVPVSGAAYVFQRSGAAWTQIRKFIAYDAQQNANLGISVAVSGTQAITGASGDRVGGQNSQGSVYAFSALPQNVFGDFDGDGRADLSVFRSSNNTWYINPSTNSAALNAAQFGLATDKLTPADFDGDGRADIAVWREGARGRFYILQSSNGQVREEDFGVTGDNPAFVGDWDGDGKADPAVYRASTSTFYFRGSANNAAGVVTYLPWGAAGDKAVRGDFDGDGKLDAAVFRPSNGVWYILQSSNGQARYENWGVGSDKFVGADFDGDGKTDTAVFRSGTWFIKQSSNSAIRYENFGLADDEIVAADYDGDGKADVAVYRLSNGIWYILQSSNSQIAYRAFGTAGDAASSSKFVQ